MMVEYAGLNPMGNRPRAGCPIKNIQQTLDHLTNAGLSVAVFEEINSQGSNRSNSNNNNVIDIKKVNSVLRSFIYYLLFIIFLLKFPIF